MLNVKKKILMTTQDVKESFLKMHASRKVPFFLSEVYNYTVHTELISFSLEQEQM